MPADPAPREPSGSALGRLLSTYTTTVPSASKGKGYRGPGRKVEDDACLAEEIVNELRGNSAQRQNVLFKSSSVKEREKTVYVLGERPARNKMVPRTKDGRCVKTLKRDTLCSKSRRRVQPVKSYNHYKEYCEDEEREYTCGRKEEDRGDEVMPANTTLGWEGRGFVSWG